MPTITKTTFKVDRVFLGKYIGTYTTPTIMLKLGSDYYSSGYTISYNSGSRTFYGSIDTTTKDVYLECLSVAYGADLQEIALTGIEVLIGD